MFNPAAGPLLPQLDDEIRAFAGFAAALMLWSDTTIEPPMVSASVMRAIASGGTVMRSSASAALFGAGSGFVSAGTTAAPLRRREARSSSSFFWALRAVTGIESTDQRSRFGSFLSTSAVNTCVPNRRSLGAIVTGTSNTGLKFCRT